MAASQETLEHLRNDGDSNVLKPFSELFGRGSGSMKTTHMALLVTLIYGSRLIAIKMLEQVIECLRPYQKSMQRCARLLQTKRACF